MDRYQIYALCLSLFLAVSGIYFIATEELGIGSIDIFVTSIISVGLFTAGCFGLLCAAFTFATIKPVDQSRNKT